jgi:ubiquinone/menaquinone biosynthesis C-methylase UbiE
LSHYSHILPFDDPERKKWQNPEEILSGIDLKPGLTFADIGCGAGFFALPAARIVGRKGKVYGLDISEAAISALKDEAAREGLANLYLTAGRAEDIVFCEQCADIVFFGISLHDFQDPAKVLENAKKTVKPTGKLVNLDWKKEASIGPPVHVRFDEAKASRLIETAGFKIETIKDSGLYHYLITARPEYR